MIRVDESLHWLAIEKDPAAAIAQGWSQNSGTVGPASTDEGFVPSSTGVDDAYVVRRLIPTDPYRFGPSRDRDTVELQWRMQGISNTPSGPWDALGVHVAFIDDNVRVVGVSQGVDLAWVHPYTGAVISQIRAAWAWQSSRTLLLTKIGAERWQVWHEGELLSEIAYDAAPETTPLSIITPTPFFAELPVNWTTARAGWGRLDTAGVGSARWDRIELGTNLAVPREWKVQRVRNTIAGPIQRVWNTRWEAMARAIVGEAQQAQSALDRAWPLTTEGRVVVESVAFSGELLPEIEDNRWVVFGGPGNQEVFGERIRIAGANTDDGVIYTVTTTPSSAEYRVRATFLVEQTVSRDREGRIGPYLQIRNNHRRITAQMVWSEASQTYGWLVHDGAASGAALGVIGNVFWPVNIFVDHAVELRVLGRNRVILFVDDMLIDDIDYDRFTAVIGTRSITIGRGDDGDIQVVCFVSHGLAEVSFTDHRTRPAFLQALAEKLVFVGGREPNHRLAAWGDLYPGVHRRRGSLIGLRTEYRRIAGHDDIDIHTNTDPAGWFLNRTFPAITPVFLDAEGLLVDAYLEFYNDIPNYTPEAFCKLVHKYLAPISAIEVQFFCALIADLTTATATAATTTFEVNDTRGFEVEDAVQLRGETVGAVATIEYVDEGGEHAADAAWVAVEFDGSTSGRFRIDAEGLGELEYTGTFTHVGLDGDRDNPHPGGTVQIVGAAANVDCWAFVFGLDGAGGTTAVWERIRADGTTPQQGLMSFSLVYGMFLDEVQAAAVKVQSTTGAVQLYVVNAGDEAVGGGALSFDPPLQGAPAKWTLSADGATTQKVLLFGTAEDQVGSGTAVTGEIVELAGATEIESTVSWEQVRAVCLGYVEAARTVTFKANANDRTADVSGVSSSALDTQTATVIGVDLDGAPAVESFPMNGTNPSFLVGPRWSRVLGVFLSADAVGTITIRQSQGDGPSDPTLTLFTIVPGQRGAGVHLRDIPCAGTVRMALNQGATTPRYVAVGGTRSDTGTFGVDVFSVEGTDWIEGVVDFDRITVIATGHLPNTKYVKIEGTSWFEAGLHGATRAIGESTKWEITSIASDQATLTYLRPDRGPQTKLRDVKSIRHSLNLANWPIRYPATLGGTAPLLLQVSENPASNPTVESRPIVVTSVQYTIDNGADFLSLWAAGDFSIFVRAKVVDATGTAGVTYIVQGTTGATGDGLRTTSHNVFTWRYAGINNAQAVVLNDGLFHSLAVVMTGFVSQLYVDGVALGATVDHLATSAAAVARLFRNEDNDQDWDYADLMLYQRPLTAGEVLTLNDDTNGNDVVRLDPDVWAHYLDPHRDPATAFEGSAVDVPGRYDDTESTTILAIDTTTNEIETVAILGSFLAGAVVRKVID